MKKLLFATALLTALFLSACGSQKADSNDLANQPATRPEEGAELDPEFSVDGEDTEMCIRDSFCSRPLWPGRWNCSQ